MDQNNFLDFYFSFRLTFADTTIWRGWYQLEIMVDETRKWLFEVAGLDFPSSTTFILDCKYFLMLILLGGLVAYRLVTADVATDRTEVGWLIAIVILMNLCAAGIVGGALGFGGSVHSFNTPVFPGMQVALFMTLAI